MRGLWPLDVVTTASKQDRERARALACCLCRRRRVTARSDVDIPRQQSENKSINVVAASTDAESGWEMLESPPSDQDEAEAILSCCDACIARSRVVAWFLRDSVSWTALKQWFLYFFGYLSPELNAQRVSSRNTHRVVLSVQLLPDCVREWWTLLTNNFEADDPRLRPGYDLYLETFCVQFFQLLLLIFGFTSMFASANVSLAAQLHNNQFSGSMVCEFVALHIAVLPWGA